MKGYIYPAHQRLLYTRSYRAQSHDGDGELCAACMLILCHLVYKNMLGQGFGVQVRIVVKGSKVVVLSLFRIWIQDLSQYLGR